MKLSRRILAALLCMILTVSPWTAVLSEEAFEPDAAAVEPEVVIEPEPDVAPIDPLPEADEVVVEPDAPEADPSADSADAPEADAPVEEVLIEDGALPAEPEDADGAGEAPGLFASEEEFAPELFASAPEGAGLILPVQFIELGVGEKRSIGAAFSDGNSYPIEYESDEPAVASVAGDGTVTAIAAGEAHIALRSEWETASVTVSVGEAPTAFFSRPSAPRWAQRAGSARIPCSFARSSCPGTPCRIWNSPAAINPLRRWTRAAW